MLLDEFAAFPRFNDTEGVVDRMFFDRDDLPEAVIFISHRWLSASHPDPDGRQLSAVKSFLTSILDLCSSREVDRDFEGKGLLERLRRALMRSGPSENPFRRLVFTHGGFQAAYFLGHYNRFDPGSDDGCNLLGLRDDALKKVGVWYDYSCMPQGTVTRENLVAALEYLHELLNASNLVALRQPGDKYDSRAWCAAEVSTDPDIERTRFRKICLRLDKLGDSFPPSLLHDQPAHLAGLPDITLKQLERAQSGADVARAVAFFIKMVGVDAEDDRDFPLFFVKRKPWIFEGHKTFLSRMIDVLAEASLLDHARAATGRGFSLSLDVALAASEAARSAGLAASKSADMPFTSLSILYARHRGAPELALLFGNCLKRLLGGQTTMLARYREARASYQVRCWYRFQDENDQGPAPDWSE